MREYDNMTDGYSPRATCESKYDERVSSIVVVPAKSTKAHLITLGCYAVCRALMVRQLAMKDIKGARPIA